ncbi:MAG: poly-beta-1,6 N-acetyl-D-glucosamine export porin PgaA [Methylococcaceae bacterium]|nr:poly-beta-1,6 N-acetyl-D-glucosamine export porin PgaA [Methylococcaceae bacterium]
MFLLWVAVADIAYADDDALAQALLSARQGDYAAALPILQDLAENHPENPEFAYEYLTVLGWAERHDVALESARRLLGDERNAPARVLESLGLSARRLGQLVLAEHYYRLALINAPKRMSSSIGFAFALAEQRSDQAKRRQAQTLIAQLRSRHPQSAEPLLGQAHLAELDGDGFSALALNLKALEREAGHREAVANIIRLADRLGAPTFARKLARLNPGILDESKLAELHLSSTASRIRTGVIDAEQKDSRDRLASLSAAIAETDSLARKAAEPNPLSSLQMRALFDRLDALCQVERMSEAVMLAELLQKRGIDLPAYVKKNLAGAYLDLGQTRPALALYRQYLDVEPKDFKARMGLFFALMDDEQMDEAETLIEQIIQDTPERIEAYSESTIRDNPDYRTVLGARAMLRVYAHRYKEAQALADQLLEAAPYSSEFRETWASVAQARGFPRRADAMWRRILIDDPDNAAARAARVSPLLEMHEFATARRMAEEALTLRPESKSSINAAREVKNHELWDFNMDAGLGTASGGDNPSGTNDLFIDSSLYSHPLADNWRVFLRHYLGQAQYQQGFVEWNRTALGGEYRARDISLAAALSEGVGGKPGAMLEAEWQIDDHWSLKGHFDSLSNAFPLRAWIMGIDANRLALDVSWRRDEAREISSAMGYMHFSDGNDRYTLSASWVERIWNGPRFRSDLSGAVWASSNSHQNAPYYNPSLDFSPSLSLHNDWASWRAGEITFHQHLNLTAGAYWQENFRTGRVLEAYYEQAWNIGSRLTLSYGFGRSLHPYDGRQVGRNYGAITLNWKF